jgi:hypothetical protein
MWFLRVRGVAAFPWSTRPIRDSYAGHNRNLAVRGEVLRVRLLRPALALSLLVAGLTPVVLQAQAAATTPVKDDVTVIAVIDSGFSPYHQDFLQSTGDAELRSLPLTKAPDTWLPGFPKPSTFAKYAPLKLTLNGETGTSMATLHTRDAAQWATVKKSTPSSIQYRWVPGTKVIGALTFGTGGTIYGSGGSEHGMGTTSVATGNIHGTCPSCLLVFLQYGDQAGAEAALTWAHKQPWIDAISNSYGFSASIVARDRVYNGTDVVTERAASERGQTTFFSAGNGLENAFTVPNSTLTSSQEGPDWVVTVGAIDPNGKDYTGTGKPADIAGIGTSYPSAYGSTTVSNGQTFSGTSNATPQVAGTYGQALYKARRSLAGPSRTQAKGIVGKGTRYACGAARRTCELADGVLTAAELRTRLLLGATPTAGGFTDGAAGVVETPAVADTRFANEGYGAYLGRLRGGYATELSRRLLGPLLGTVASPTRPAEETAWFRVDSFCRQHIWGEWRLGSYLDRDSTPLPQASPAWPTRTAIQQSCPSMTAPPKT